MAGSREVILNAFPHQNYSCSYLVFGSEHVFPLDVRTGHFCPMHVAQDLVAR